MVSLTDEYGEEIETISFGIRRITLFQNGYVTISTLGSVGGRVGGFLKGIEKIGNSNNKEEQDRFFAEAKANFKNPTEKLPDKLVSIDLDTSNVTKKTGIGRGIAAIVTVGVSLNAPSNRGDIYLIIVTKNETYSYHQTFPEEREIRELKRFVATAKSLI
jgi:hypothetical protein